MADKPGLDGRDGLGGALIIQEPEGLVRKPKPAAVVPASLNEAVDRLIEQRIKVSAVEHVTKMIDTRPDMRIRIFDDQRQEVAMRGVFYYEGIADNAAERTLNKYKFGSDNPQPGAPLTEEYKKHHAAVFNELKARSESNNPQFWETEAAVSAAINNHDIAQAKSSMALSYTQKLKASFERTPPAFGANEIMSSVNKTLSEQSAKHRKDFPDVQIVGLQVLDNEGKSVFKPVGPFDTAKIFDDNVDPQHTAPRANEGSDKKASPESQWREPKVEDVIPPADGGHAPLFRPAPKNKALEDIKRGAPVAEEPRDRKTSSVENPMEHLVQMASGVQLDRSLKDSLPKIADGGKSFTLGA